MIGEVSAVVAEVSAEAAKEAAKETAKEMGKAAAEKSVDVAKRVDVSSKALDAKSITGDISKRITPGEVASEVPKEGKDLTSSQISELVSKGMSPGIVNDCKFQDGIYKLKTTNEKLCDTVHPETGVKYERKVVDLFGSKIEGVFPKFESVFTAQLPSDKLIATDAIQKSECLSQLQSAIKANPSLGECFTPRQLELIADGKMPGGFTWNHNEEVGKMELVDFDKHASAGHTGGKAIWGGGNR